MKSRCSQKFFAHFRHQIFCNAMITLGCRDPEKGIRDSKYAGLNGKEELV